VSVATAVAFWATTSHVLPAAGGGWRGLGNAPSPGRIAMAVAAGLLVAGLLHRRQARERAPLLLLFCAALPLIPVWSGRALPLLAFQGPLLVLLAFVVAGLCLAPRLSALGGAATVSLWLVFATGFAFYATLAQRLPGRAGPQGDEPQYLVMTHSLLSDGDLDLTDEFARAEYLAFFHGRLEPHPSPHSPPGRVYSLHSPGLPALILPAYALGGYAGVRLFLAALAALTGLLVFHLVRDVMGPGAAIGAWALLTFTPPLAFYSNAVYPEAVAVLATAVFLLTSRGHTGWPAGLAAAVAAALLPWLHSKMLPLAVMGLLLTLLRPSRWRVRAVAAAIFLASVAALLLFFKASYGQATFSAAFGPPDLAWARAPRGTLAMLLDRQYGLLTTAPVWAWAFPGFVLLLRRRTGDGLRALLLAAMPVVVGAPFAMWWGGSCPPARFLLPALPALAVCLAAAATTRPALVSGLAAAGLALVGLAADAPRILHNRADGDSLLLRYLSPSLDLNGFLPSFIATEEGTVLLALAVAAAFALTWAWGVKGVLAGAACVFLVARAYHERPRLDPRAATLEVLEAWEPGHFSGPAGPPRVQALALPLDLPRAPWLMDAGQVRHSRRLGLPPGAYRLEVRARAVGGFAALLAFHVGGLRLATASVTHEAPLAVVPLLLPVGAQGFGLTARHQGGMGEIESVRVLVDALSPRSRRAALEWPEFPWPDRYRVPAGQAWVTILDRTEPLPGAFRLGPAGGRFVVDGPAAAELMVHVTAPGSSAPHVLRHRLAEGLDLGSGSVLPVSIEVPGALVRFTADPPR
jgi:hypothetical protein